LTTLATVDVFELHSDLSKVPILTYPTYIWRLPLGMTQFDFVEIFGIRELESLGYRLALFA